MVVSDALYKTETFFSFFLFKKLFMIYFGLHWIFIAAPGLLSSCREESGGYSVAAVHGLLFAVTYCRVGALGAWAQ